MLHDVMTNGDGDDWYCHLSNSIENGELTVEITLEQYEQAIAEHKQKVIEHKDHIVALIREEDDLIALSEQYRDWPLEELRSEYAKYGGERDTDNKNMMAHFIVITRQADLSSKIDASEHAIQELWEEVVEFEREVKRFKSEIS